MTDSPINPPVLAWGAATHQGRVRTGNEDNYVAEPMVFGVADGMGGHQAGEVASEIAASTMRDRLHSGAASVDLMVAAVVEANAAIFQGAHTNPDQRGMGTTLTAMAAMPAGSSGYGRLVLANVGDSRTYLYRAGRLRRVSVDHSYVQELVSTGHITEAEARSHPRRNIVTRALGIEPTVKVDTWVHPLVRGDRYLLCSDGLVDEVDDAEIAAVLAAHPQPQAAAEALVTAANTNGGRDNVTVVVVDVLDGEVLQPDTAELLLDVDLDDAWADEHDRLIDAEAGTDGATPDPGRAGMATTGAASGAATSMTTGGQSDLDDDGLAGQARPAAGIRAATGPITMEMPAVAGAPRRRSPLGWMLFAFAFAAIVTVAVVLVLVVRHNDSDPTPATTSTSTSTTSTTAVPDTDPASSPGASTTPSTPSTPTSASGAVPAAPSPASSTSGP